VDSFGKLKKRRKKGSWSSGLFRGTRSVNTPRVAMFTTAGDATLIMGASEGSATATPPAEADGGIHEADRVMRRTAAMMSREADRKRISVVSRVRIL
jgi:hypothetical protein